MRIKCRQNGKRQVHPAIKPPDQNVPLSAMRAMVRGCDAVPCGKAW
jgi:hypothetical protein